MKKFSLLAVLLSVCFPILSFAQPAKKIMPLQIGVGIKAGANFSKLNGGDTWTGGYRTGLHGGVFANVGIKRIGGQIEAIYSTATYTADGSNLYQAAKNTGVNYLKNIADSSRSGSVGVTYINVPLLLNLKLFGNAWIQLGPQYTAVLSVKDKDGLLANKDGLFNGNDVSGVAGVWLKLPAGLNAGVRYIFGLSDQNLSSIGESWKTRTIQLHIGYSFL